MRRAGAIAAGILALLSWDCTKRQAATRIVFVDSTPPPAPTASAEAAGALVLAEPQLPERDEEVSPPAPEPAEKPHTRPRVRLTPADPATEAEPEPALTGGVPTLEPRENAAGQAPQRQQVVQLQDHIRARMARQDRPSLAAAERRMLGDARTFLAQSERALSTSDFQRALTLARKASILLSVLEQQ